MLLINVTTLHLLQMSLLLIHHAYDQTEGLILAAILEFSQIYLKIMYI